MYHQRFSRGFFCRYSGEVGEPVVRVDNVKVVLLRNGMRQQGVLRYLIQQILSGSPCKLKAAGKV
jgi:hypothetical protein